MRLYYTVSRILLILTVTDFALAGPVLLQEKLRAPVDGAHNRGRDDYVGEAGR